MGSIAAIAAVAIVSGLVIRLLALRRGIANVLDPRLVLWAAFVALYVVPPYVAGSALWRLVTREEYAYFLLLALCCGVLCELGVAAGLRYPQKTSAMDISRAEERRARGVAVIIFLAGTAAYAYFIGASGGIAQYYSGHGKGNFRDVSGYVYEMRYFIFAALLLFSLLYRRGALGPRHKVLLFGTAVFLAGDAWFTVQRGSWIRIGIITAAAIALSRPSPTRQGDRSLAAIVMRLFGLGAICSLAILLVLLSPSLRGHTDWSRATVSNQVDTFWDLVDSGKVLRRAAGGSTLDEGNELAVAVASVEARDRTGEWDGGIKWLYPFLNFVPRGMWPDKPKWDDFSLSLTRTMARGSHWVPPTGAAETGVADSYFRFVWGAPLFWMLLGVLLGRRFARAQGGALWAVADYACLLCGFVYFLTQNMLPFVDFYIFMAAPIAVARFVVKRRLTWRGRGEPSGGRAQLSSRGLNVRG